MPDIDIEAAPIDTIEDIIGDSGSPQVEKLPPIQQAGYKLAKIVLIIIAAYVAFLIGLFLFTELHVNNHILNEGKATLLTPEEEMSEKESYRSFIMNISQLVLLNLLLPILTAILGYIFGSNESRKTT